MDAKTFGGFIAQCRKEAGMTQAQLVGVGLPLYCLLGFFLLQVYGIWRKATGKTSGRTFLLAFALLSALLLTAGLFFLAGAMGIGPVPN